MCGIAGLVDLEGRREPDPHVLARMAAAIVHRGPDEDGTLIDPGVGLASRRLSIVGLADGRQPIWNEDRTIAVVFNGELFDHVELRAELGAQGHQFRTSCDTEVLVHLWEQYGEQMFARVRGQFAFVLYDRRQRQVILARDRVGICPLHWTVHRGWLYFASEIKALVASEQVPIRADVRGLDHIFTFYAMPSRRTAFENISVVAPGHYLKIRLPGASEPGDVREQLYWDFDFPDQGEEYEPRREVDLVDEFDGVLRRAVELRLRADVPVVSYLSAGIDSSMALAVASQLRGEPLASFTIQIVDPRLDETGGARVTAQHVGSPQTVLRCDGPTLSGSYPELVAAAESPVIDTSSSALLRLSREVHRQGFKVALTGEGSDEALAGYPWFKINKLLRLADCGAFRPSTLAGRFVRLWGSRLGAAADGPRIDALFGGHQAQSDMYHLMSVSRYRFYSAEMFAALGGHVAYEDLDLNLKRMRRWHPLNQSLYIGYKTLLPGLLLSHKGDRVAMANSVETRYPFLDENVIALCCRVHPRWKLRGLRRDKYLLRRTAERYLPLSIAARPKAMFRAPPFANTFLASRRPATSSPSFPRYVDQLLSEESLRRTPYFDAAKVRAWYERYWRGEQQPGRRFFVEMGLVAVLTTQLWHHYYLGGGLCELPVLSANPERPAERSGAL